MALPVRSLGEGTARNIGGLRELIQDLVTPDLKAMKASHEALQQELRFRTEALSQELKIRFEGLQEELRLRDAMQTRSFQSLESGLQEELRLRDAMQTRSFQSLESSLQKLTDAVTQLSRKVEANNIDLRERVAAIEARLPKQ